MKVVAYSKVVFAVLSLLTTGCHEQHTLQFYRTLQGHATGPVVVRSGKHVVRKSETAFARQNMSALTADEVADLPASARSLLLRRLMLRRLCIEDGLSRGIFDTDEARRFILPRLEKILEEYYIFERSQEAAFKHQLRRIQNDEEAIKAFLNQERLDGISTTQFRNATQSAIQSLIAMRHAKERSRIHRELLQKHSIEVLPTEVLK